MVYYSMVYYTKRQVPAGGIHKVCSTVDRILAGEFNTDNHFLDFSTPRIELSVHGDESVQGSFFIYGPENCMTEGSVTSSSLGMKCLT